MMSDEQYLDVLQRHVAARRMGDGDDHEAKWRETVASLRECITTQERHIALLEKQLAEALALVREQSGTIQMQHEAVERAAEALRDEMRDGLRSQSQETR